MMKCKVLNVSNLYSPKYIKCVEINNYPQNSAQKSFITRIKSAQNTLESLERSLRKSSKYEQKILHCKKSCGRTHEHFMWGDGQSEQKPLQCSHRNGYATSSTSRTSGVGQTKSWSTTSLIHLQNQYKELLQRHKALLQEYEVQCVAITARDKGLSQLNERANQTHEQLTQAHKAFLDVSGKYLELKRKNALQKAQCQEGVKRMRSMLHDVVEITTREQLRFDANLSYCLIKERNADTALLLHEIRKCNLLFIENMQLKTIIQDILLERVNGF